MEYAIDNITNPPVISNKAGEEFKEEPKLLVTKNISDEKVVPKQSQNSQNN